MFVLNSLPAGLVIWPSLLMLAALGLSLWRAPWRQLGQVPVRQHAWYAASLGLGLFWLLQVNVREVLAFHPLAITTFTLVFGWSLTCLGGAVALALNVMMSQRLGLNLPLEFVINVLVPATASIGFISLLERLRVRNVFIFMLGGGFIGAMVALLCSVAAALALFGLGGAVAEEQMLQNYLHLYLLMLFPEGFINGAMTSVLTIFYPDMVRRYDDNAYLDKP